MERGRHKLHCTLGCRTFWMKKLSFFTFHVVHMRKQHWKVFQILTIWKLPNNCLKTTWWLPDNYLMTAWQLLDNFLTDAWQLPDYCLTLTWPLNHSKDDFAQNWRQTKDTQIMKMTKNYGLMRLHSLKKFWPWLHQKLLCQIVSNFALIKAFFHDI